MARPPQKRLDIRKNIDTVLKRHMTAEKLDAFIVKLMAEEGPGKVATFYMSLLEYTMPKLARVEHTGTNGEALTVEHVLKSISGNAQGSALPSIDMETDEASQIAITDEASQQSLDTSQTKTTSSIERP